MKIRVLDANDASNRGHWMEAHLDGCAHLNKRTRWGDRLIDNAWPAFDADTKTDAAGEIASDFIDEGSCTIDEARDSWVHFAPCLRGLPK